MLGDPHFFFLCFLLVAVGWFWLFNEKFEKDVVPCASTHKSARNNGVQDPCFVFSYCLADLGRVFGTGT